MRQYSPGDITQYALDIQLFIDDRIVHYKSWFRTPGQQLGSPRACWLAAPGRAYARAVRGTQK